MKLTTSTILRRAVERACRLPLSLVRTGRWPLALGALLLAASTASVVATANSAPQFNGIRTSTRLASEGDTVTLVGWINDPDTGDNHTLLVSWDGGESDDKQKVQLPPGQSHFELSHVYVDNVPTNHIKLVVYDHQLPVGANDNTTGGLLSDTEYLPFQVRNVEPEFVEGSIKVQKVDRRRVIVEGDFTDPGTADRMQVYATWSDRASPETTLCSLSDGDRHFRCEHLYPPPLPFGGIKMTYTIGLIVKDDEGSYDEHETRVQIP